MHKISVVFMVDIGMLSLISRLILLCNPLLVLPHIKFSSPSTLLHLDKIWRYLRVKKPTFNRKLSVALWVFTHAHIADPLGWKSLETSPSSTHFSHYHWKFFLWPLAALTLNTFWWYTAAIVSQSYLTNTKSARKGPTALTSQSFWISPHKYWFSQQYEYEWGGNLDPRPEGCIQKHKYDFHSSWHW